jgi:hypothetical protein
MFVQPAFKSVDEYNKAHYPWPKEKLLEEAKTAMAWTQPDRESTGYSINELTSLIRRLVKYIETNS